MEEMNMSIEGAGKDEVFQLAEAQKAHTIIQAAITAAILKDESLRDSISKDPKGGIEKALDIKFDDDLTVKVLDAEDRSVLFTLPPKAERLGKLSDSDIEKIAGGFNFAMGAQMATMGSTIVGDLMAGIGQAVGGKAGKGLTIAGASLGALGKGANQMMQGYAMNRFIQGGGSGAG